MKPQTAVVCAPGTANARRSELAAAIIAAAPPDPERLLRLIIAWRKHQVRDVVLGVDSAV